MVHRIPLKDLDEQQLNQLYDRIDALDRGLQSTANDALRHQGCHSKLIRQLKRAEEAEKDNERYEEAVGELNEDNIRLQRKAARAELVLNQVREDHRTECLTWRGLINLGFSCSLCELLDPDKAGASEQGNPPVYAGHPGNGQNARADLLNVFASWGFTSRFGSREVVDAILEKHRQEIKEQK